MKKILITLTIILIMFGAYKLFDYSIKNANKNIITNTVENINEATDITVRQSATNFINKLELEIASEYALGNTENFNTTYTNPEINIKGLKPINISLEIVMGKVINGTMEYEKYIITIIDGKVNEMNKK